MDSKSSKQHGARKSNFSRRDFVANTLMAAASLFVAKFGLAASAKHAITNPVDNNNMNNTASTLAKRKLGSLEVTELDFGCMNIAWTYGNTPAKDDAIKLILAAYEQGVRFFDTAEIYGPPISERIAGEALKPFCKDVEIASKIGLDIDFETAQMKGGLKSNLSTLNRLLMPC